MELSAFAKKKLLLELSAFAIRVLQPLIFFFLNEKVHNQPVLKTIALLKPDSQRLAYNNVF